MTRARLALETALERVLPQASHVPLVLYRLYPLAIEIVTAVAFGDTTTAEGRGGGSWRSCPRRPIATSAAADCWTMASNARNAPVRYGNSSG